METREYVESRIKECNAAILDAVAERDEWREKLDALIERERELTRMHFDSLMASLGAICSNRSCGDCPYGVDETIHTDGESGTSCVFETFERITAKVLKND